VKLRRAREPRCVARRHGERRGGLGVARRRAQHELEPRRRQRVRVAGEYGLDDRGVAEPHARERDRRALLSLRL